MGFRGHQQITRRDAENALRDKIDSMTDYEVCNLLTRLVDDYNNYEIVDSREEAERYNNRDNEEF
jgi:hypothetical protein